MMQGGVQLNQNGERFSNEHGGYSEQAARVLVQPEQMAFNIFDGRIHAGCLSFEDYKNAHAAGAVKVFDSLESMASALDMPLARLRATFKEIDELIASGQPDPFGRRFTQALRDRKSTRLNSSHVRISYAVFCLKKKKTYTDC